METPKYRTALIVGAGEGLSASLARLFAREGLRVALAARSIEKLGALCAETKARAYACNATDADEVERLFGLVEREIGKPDLVVYNASARARGPVVDLVPAEVAQAIGDYFRHGLAGRGEDPRAKLLYAIEDPYSYRDRLTMPKFVVNAAGDQYFPPDSSQFYFGDLPGEKSLRYVANADHSLRDSDAQESIIAFYQLVLAGKPRPTRTCPPRPSARDYTQGSSPTGAVIAKPRNSPARRQPSPRRPTC